MQPTHHRNVASSSRTHAISSCIAHKQHMSYQITTYTNTSYDTASCSNNTHHLPYHIATHTSSNRATHQSQTCIIQSNTAQTFVRPTHHILYGSRVQYLAQAVCRQGLVPNRIEFVTFEGLFVECRSQCHPPSRAMLWVPRMQLWRAGQLWARRCVHRAKRQRVKDEMHEEQKEDLAQGSLAAGLLIGVAAVKVEV